MCCYSSCLHGWETSSEQIFHNPYGLLFSAGARFLSDAWLDGLLLVMILGVLQAPLLKLESRSVVDKLCLPVLFASKSRNQRALFCVESSASCEVIGFQCLDQSTSSLSTRAPMPWMEIFFLSFFKLFVQHMQFCLLSNSTQRTMNTLISVLDISVQLVHRLKVMVWIFPKKCINCTLNI